MAARIIHIINRRNKNSAPTRNVTVTKAKVKTKIQRGFYCFCEIKDGESPFFSIFSDTKHTFLQLVGISMLVAKPLVAGDTFNQSVVGIAEAAEAAAPFHVPLLLHLDSGLFLRMCLSCISNTHGSQFSRKIAPCLIHNQTRRRKRRRRRDGGGR